MSGARWLGWYSTNSLVDPKGLSTGLYRVFRGGSFYSPAPGSVRSAMRGRDAPGLRSFKPILRRLVNHLCVILICSLEVHQPHDDETM